MINNATHEYINKNGVVCYGMKTKDDFFVLSEDHTKWIRMHNWVYLKYFAN